MNTIVPVEFVEFRKIPRLSRECVITEKIDGTNAQIHIDESGTFIKVGSRSRWLTFEEDNYGFYKWAMENREELLLLGPGRHFGEWWGGGIQRGYGLPKGEKRFSLFNTSRWNADTPPPSCCSVVPVLYRGEFDTRAVLCSIEALRAYGSFAAPGFMRPEGVVVYHVAANQYFKKTLEKDEAPKGQQ